MWDPAVWCFCGEENNQPYITNSKFTVSSSYQEGNGELRFVQKIKAAADFCLQGFWLGLNLSLHHIIAAIPQACWGWAPGQPGKGETEAGALHWLQGQESLRTAAVVAQWEEEETQTSPTALCTYRGHCHQGMGNGFLSSCRTLWAFWHLDAIGSFRHLDREKWEEFVQGRAVDACSWLQVHTKVMAFCDSAGWTLNTELDK